MKENRNCKVLCERKTSLRIFAASEELLKQDKTDLQGRWWARRILSSPPPRVLLDNTPISVNSPESDLKTGGTDSTAKCREEASSKQVSRIETLPGSKQTEDCLQEGGTPQAQGKEGNRPRRKEPARKSGRGMGWGRIMPSLRISRA